MTPLSFTMSDSITPPVPLSTRMKSYEHVETLQRFDKTKPIYVRVDGRGFSKFTRGMTDKDNDQEVVAPGFSMKFADAMQKTAKYLLEQTRATMAFVQSDEISLVFSPVPTESTTEIFFAGKKQKVVSTIASLATAKFLQLALEYWPERVSKKLPTFDCRALNLPDEAEVANTLLFRCRDGTRNSISTMCREFRSAKKLHGVNSQEMLKMLEDAGVIWNNIPRHFREGTFYTLNRQGIEELIPNELYATLPFERKVEVIFGAEEAVDNVDDQ